MDKFSHKYFLYIIVSALLAGCSDDIIPEITSLETSRLFSPTDITATVVNQTSVRLSWKAVHKAESYTVEIFTGTDLSGTPVKRIEDVSFEQVPYTVPGLDGEAEYTVRVKAVGTEIAASKWVEATFKTDPEQIFQAIIPDELEAKQVTLHWPAGETASEIVLTPGNITHPVTAEEIAAGEATITGLSSETAYTAKLMNGSRTRGTITFTTLLDLGGAIAVQPEDDLAAKLAAANDGDVFALFPGEYPVQDIAVTKSISIKGAKPSDKPVLKGAIFRITGGAGLELNALVLDGTGADGGNQTIIYDEDRMDSYAALKIQDCEISHYSKGTFYVNKKCLIESVSITGTVYHDIEGNGGDFIDFRSGLAKTFEYRNNTAYNSALARDFFRMDAGGSGNFPGISSTITISNNTFYNVSTGGSNRILYIRLASHMITFDKNILANMGGIYTNQSATTIREMQGNNYFQAPNYTAGGYDTGSYTTFDPGFVNPGAGDFTVTNEDVKIAGAGDQRWLK